jgi:2-polyprenyl-3-methyl-5-hydroxy-6-metoxy-1,4-benzoquinol methylase
VEIVTEGSLASGYARWRRSQLGRITDAIERRELLRQCGPMAGKQVLDVGCGDGFISIAMAKSGGAVTCVDADEAMLNAAKANAAREDVSVTFRNADAHALPFQGATFDLVVAVSLLCLVRDRELAIAEMARVLRLGGRIVIGELGSWSLWNMWRRMRGAMGARPWRDAHFFTPAELRRMLARAGCKAISVTGAIYYPPAASLAAVMTPLDSFFSRLSAFGAAFLLASAERTSA